MKDTLSLSLDWRSGRLQLWSLLARRSLCVCGAVTDSVTIAEDVFAGIFSLFTLSSCEKMILQLAILSCDAGVSLNKMFFTP